MSAGLRVGGCLPLSVAVTAAVTLLPLLAVAQLGPARTALVVAMHVLIAIALSMLIARALAALWVRYGDPTDLVFGDLLLWGLIRRAVAERRLAATSRDLCAGEIEGDERLALLRRMSTLLEARDPYTHGHSQRVARHAQRIARELGLPREQVRRICTAALVHDIGKVNVPRAILNKPARLTDAEFCLVKRHPGDGARMLAELGDPELEAIVRHHHERIDGSGYPDGLAGVDIPLGARILAVADTFDAMTSTRAYRRARTHKQALAVLHAEGGAQLDCDAVAAFASYYAARRSVGWASMVTAAPQRLASGLGGFQSGVASSVAPTAQAICGVGGAALIGACLSGPLLPAGSGAPDPAQARKPAAERLAAAPAAPAPPLAAAALPSRRAEREPGRGTATALDPVSGGSGSDRRRTLRSAPAPEAPQGGSGSDGPAPRTGTDEPVSGETAPVNLPELVDVPDLPAVPKAPALPPQVGGLVKPVTDALPDGLP